MLVACYYDSSNVEIHSASPVTVARCECGHRDVRQLPRPGAVWSIALAAAVAAGRVYTGTGLTGERVMSPAAVPRVDPLAAQWPVRRLFCRPRTSAPSRAGRAPDWALRGYGRRRQVKPFAPGWPTLPSRADWHDVRRDGR